MPEEFVPRRDRRDRVLGGSSALGRSNTEGVVAIGKYNVAQQVEGRRNWLLSADESFRPGDVYPAEVYEAIAAQGLGPEHTILFAGRDSAAGVLRGKVWRCGADG